MPETEWEKYRLHILAEIQRFNETARSVDAKVETIHREVIPEIKTRIALLEQRAAIWGAGAAIVTTGIIGLLTRFIK